MVLDVRRPGPSLGVGAMISGGVPAPGAAGLRIFGAQGRGLAPQADDEPVNDAQAGAPQRTAARDRRCCDRRRLATAGYATMARRAGRDPRRRSWSEPALGSVRPIARRDRGAGRSPRRNASSRRATLHPATLAPDEPLVDYAAAAQLAPGAPLPAGAAAWLGMRAFASYSSDAIPLLLLLFRTATAVTPWRWSSVRRSPPLPSRWSPGRSAGVVDVAPQVDNRYGISAAPWLRYVTLVGAFLTLIGGSVAGLVAVAARLRHATGGAAFAAAVAGDGRTRPGAVPGRRRRRQRHLLAQ